MTPERDGRLYTALKTAADAEKRVLRLALQKTDASLAAIPGERRVLDRALSEIGEAIQPDGSPGIDPPIRDAIIRQLADFRSATMVHWSKWPMSTVTADLEGYMDSARAVAKTSQSFWLACRAHLKIDF
jgi:hypothetical protein